MTLSITHTITSAIGTNVLSVAVVEDVGMVVELNEAVPIASTDLLMALTLDVTQLKTIFILADQDLTLETNSNNAAGGQTIALKANNPYEWHYASGITCPLTPDITALYVTNASGVATILKARFGVDPTI